MYICKKRLRSLENWDDASVLASHHHLRRWRRKSKITVLLFQIFLPVTLVWKRVCGWRSKPARLDSSDPCVFTSEQNKKHNTASGRDVRVPVHREDQGNDNPQCTPPSSLPPPPYAIYSYLQYLTPDLHGTTRNEFSVWSHVNKGIKSKAKLVIKHFLFPLWRAKQGVFVFWKHTWGVKQQNSRNFQVAVAGFLVRWDVTMHRWTLGHVIHKHMPAFCKYPVKTDKRELDMVNVMPFSVVHIPSFRPIRSRHARLTMPRFKTNCIFFIAINRN